MSVFAVHELDPGVQVRVTRPMPPLPQVLECEVEALWRRAESRMARGGAGRLFNGDVFSADTIGRTLITGHITEYRRVVAQFERPELFEQLGLRSLAVCGVLRCADGVPIGRRHVDAIYEAGLWQLPPAGRVDGGAVDANGTVDLRRQIVTELGEELGLSPDCLLGAPVPLCVVEHAATHVADLGMALSTGLDGAAVLAAHRASGNTEYRPLAIVPFAELPGHVGRLGGALVPSALHFLRCAGLLRE
jgi:hypothetical protein